MLPMIFFAICAIATIICGAFSVYKTVELTKNPQHEIDYKGYIKRTVYLILGTTVAFTAMLVWIYPWAKITPKVYEAIQAVLGGVIFSCGLITFINSFIFHYYRKELPSELHKWSFRVMMIAFAATVVSLFITLNGYADYLTYPLVNSISFSEGFVSPLEQGNIAFYAIFILSGAIYVYLLIDHKLYMEYGEHGIAESTFLVAFPAGIIGARVAYVIGNFNVPSDKGGFDGVFSADVFKIWNGGLTILGGAIAGIVVGVLWFLWRKRKYNPWIVIDLDVPAILIAQAVGRWGNFCNLEVHGFASPESNWAWLPRIVLNNLRYSTATNVVTMAPEGFIYVPLFFIEGLINLLGFGVLAHLFGIKLRKYTELGDLAFGYVIWYGLTRVILEPLRDPAYNMGEDGYWSWVWSMVFVIAGCLLILANHLIRDYLRNRKNKLVVKQERKSLYTYGLIVFAVVSVMLVATGAVLMGIGTFTGTIAYNKFNMGLISLILGISTLMIAAIPVVKLIEIKKLKTNE